MLLEDGTLLIRWSVLFDVWGFNEDGSRGVN